MKTNVIIDIGPGDPDFEIFSPIGIAFKFKQKSVIDVLCDKADFTGPFAELTLALPKKFEGLVISIPLKRIIMAYSDPRGKVGFSLFKESK